MVRRSIRIAPTFVACFVLALATLLVTHTGRAQAQGNGITLSILTSNENIIAGDVARFTVMLENTGDVNVPNIELVLSLDGQVETVRLLPDGDASSGFRTDGTRRSDQQIIWRGGLAAGGKLVFDVAAKSMLLDQTITLYGDAGPVDEEPIISDSGTVEARAYDLNPNDISITKLVLWNDGTGFTKGEEAEVLPGQEVGVEIRLTNNSPATVFTLLVDEMGQAGGSDVSCRLEPVASAIVSGRGFSVPPRALGDSFLPTGETIQYAFLVRTPAGETSVTRLRGRVVGEGECTVEGQAKAFSTAIGPGDAEFDAAEVAMAENVAPKLEFIQGLLELEPKLSAIVAFLILLSDFGDAPDSSNHFTPGTMTAYAPNVTANFPTVFDPATGADQGPKHRNGRPLHLGQRVSGELAVDVGLLRNIDPPGDRPDLDLHDDGINSNGPPFQSCTTTTIPVQVTVTQKAVDYVKDTGKPLYLNIWLDGNRNGDWADELACGDLTAVEHIVIDQELLPAAAGTLIVAALTGNIPVPNGGQNQNMWLRVMVSDERSVKTDSFQDPGLPVQEYGDGRGPSDSYRWGETEDYLYVPNGGVGGPAGGAADLDLTADAIIQGGYFTPGNVSAAAAAGWDEGVAALKLRIRNGGDRSAVGPVLQIEMEPYLGLPQSLSIEGYHCLTCIVASGVAPLPQLTDVGQALALPVKEVCEGEKCRLEIALDDIPPGRTIGLVMHYPHCNGTQNCSTTTRPEVTFKATIESADDADIGNNTAQRTALRLAREPIITAPTPGLFTGCLTCTTLFKGFAEPGTTVSINADGISGDSLSAVADAQGFWQIEALLAGGINQIELGWTGCLTCTVYAGLADAGIAVDGSYIFGEELSLTVDRSLFWNPNSFGYTRTTLEELQGAAVTEADDSCGPWQIVDDAGRMELDNWRIPVWSGKEIELGVELFCETEPSAALKYLDQQVQFTDKDGDGYFTATFTPEIDDEVLAGVDSELSISCGDETAVYSGKMVPVQPVQVVDRDTGEPLAGMNVELFRANRATDAGNTGAGNAQFTAWEAHAFGQTNPQQTDGNGHFSYIVPRGRYGLVVTGDGYQPFRAGPVRGQGPITGFNIGMPPALSSAGNEVVQITEDGFLPAMLKVNAGTVVRWQNISLDTASTQSVADGVTGVAVNAAAWDSGLLLSGETHTVRFDKEGTYTYVDAADPSKTAIIQIVKPASPDGEEIFLPFMIR